MQVMIISASRRSDIPAFFGEYFIKALKSKQFKTVNPFNRKVKIIDFEYKDIDGIVFWTKNPKNFLKYIGTIKNMDIPFYFQFTLNNYPEYIEPELPDIYHRIDILKELYENIYPRKIIWRYDPIILSEEFPSNFHKENFSFLIENLSPYIHHVTVSVLTLYRKIRKNFTNLITDRDKLGNLLKNLYDIADYYGKKLDVCCFHNTENVPAAKCVDISLLNNKRKSKRDNGQRKACNCDKSIDIGYYGTCKHKCLYCYAK